MLGRDAGRDREADLENDDLEGLDVGFGAIDLDAEDALDRAEEAQIIQVCREMLSADLDPFEEIEGAPLPTTHISDTLVLDEVIQLLHYAYWAIRKKDINVKNVPYQVSIMWDRLRSLIEPIIEFEMQSKGDRYYSLLKRGIDEGTASKLSWHRLVNGSTIDFAPRDVILSIPGIGPNSFARIKRLVDPLNGKASI